MTDHPEVWKKGSELPEADTFGHDDSVLGIVRGKSARIPQALLTSDSVRTVQTIDDLALIKADSLKDGQSAQVVSTGRAGLFRWQSGDLSAEVAADPDRLVYVPSNNDPSGETGAWVLNGSSGRSALLGNDGRRYAVIAGAVRNPGTGWEFIQDSAHNPSRVTGVSASGITLTIEFDVPEGGRVVTGMVVPDEALSRHGLIVGPSLARDYMDIRGFLPLELSLETDGPNSPILTVRPELASQVSASRQGFSLRVNHPAVQDQGPVVSRHAGAPDVWLESVNDGAFNLRQLSSGQNYYRVRYTAGEWQLATNDSGASLDSSSFTSNGNLVVNLGAELGARDPFFQSVSNRYNPARIISSGASSFTLRFVDAATGADITTEAETSMESYILYGPQKVIENTSTTLPAGKYTVRRGHIPVDWSDIVSPDSHGGNTNLWFYAVIELPAG